MDDWRRESLLELLRAYVPEDERDARNASRFREILARPDPFGRSNPEHVTASAIVTRPNGASVMLVFHEKLARWLQPGGHVEPEDESVFAAAKREVREETGLTRCSAPIRDAILDLDVHRIPPFGREGPHVHFDVRFLLTASDERASQNGAAWFPFPDVAPADADGSLSRAAAKARERLGRS